MILSMNSWKNLQKKNPERISRGIVRRCKFWTKISKKQSSYIVSQDFFLVKSSVLDKNLRIFFKGSLDIFLDQSSELFLVELRENLYDFFSRIPGKIFGETTRGFSRGLSLEVSLQILFSKEIIRYISLKNRDEIVENCCVK